MYFEVAKETCTVCFLNGACRVRLREPCFQGASWCRPKRVRSSTCLNPRWVACPLQLISSQLEAALVSASKSEVGRYRKEADEPAALYLTFDDIVEEIKCGDSRRASLAIGDRGEIACGWLRPHETNWIS